MDSYKKAKYKNILEKEKKDTNRNIQRFEELNVDKKTQNFIGELSNYDNHPADIGSELFKDEHNLGLMDMQMNNIKNIKDAISRIDKDDYGMCMECENIIDEERLEVIPETKLCIHCARSRDSIIKDVRTCFKSNKEGECIINTPLGVKKISDPLFLTKNKGEALDDVMSYGSSENSGEENRI